MSAVKCLFGAGSVNVERVIFARYFGKKAPENAVPLCKKQQKTANLLKQTA